MSVESSNDRVHHPYSPSQLQSLEACDCYVSKQSEVVHERTAAGTRAHAVAETGEDDNALGDDDAAAAAECLDFVESRRVIFEDARWKYIQEVAQFSLNEVGGKNGTLQNFMGSFDDETPAVQEIKEAYLPIDDIRFPDGVMHTTAGYVDHGFIGHDEKYAELYDWKFGFWPVEEASNNLQGLAYALGLFRRHPKLESVRFFFKQPHLSVISDHIVKREDIPAIYLRIQVIVAKARAARASGDFVTASPRVPACNFCANLGKCPAVSALMCKVGHKFHPLAVPENITPTMVHDTRDTTLALRLAGVCGAWAKAFKAQLTDRIIRGAADIPPEHVLQSRTPREIADPAKYEEVALRFVTPAELKAASSITFGKVEDAIKDKAPRGQKTAMLETFNAALETAGAIKHGQPYTFLRAVAPKKDT